MTRSWFDQKVSFQIQAFWFWFFLENIVTVHFHSVFTCVFALEKKKKLRAEGAAFFFFFLFCLFVLFCKIHLGQER